MKRKVLVGCLALAAILCAGAARAGDVVVESRTVSTLGHGASASLALFTDVLGCDRLALTMTLGAKDSAYATLSWSSDGATFWTTIDTVKVWNTGAGVKTKYKQFSHIASDGTTKTNHYDGFMYPYLRIAITSAKVHDALVGGTVTLFCGQ